MRTIVALLVGVGTIRAQLYRWEPKLLLRARSIHPFARTASVWLRDSFWVDFAASTGGWRLDSLVVTRYDASNRPIWDSCHKWNSAANQWTLRERYGYYYYSSGSFAGYDSMLVRYAPLNPSDKQHFFYTDLGGGRIRIEIRDSSLSGGNRWEAGFRYFIWGPRARLEAGGDYDSLLIQAFAQNSWQDALRFHNFFSGNRLDSTAKWINARYLMDLPLDVIVRGYTRYYYDASNRLERKRDTLWLVLPNEGPAQAGWTWYFYTGSSTRPSKDSTVLRDYGSGTSISVTSYDYDPTHGNLIKAEIDTCSPANPANCQDYQRERYSYRQGVMASVSSQPTLPSFICGGCPIRIELEEAVPYRIMDVMGRTIAEGTLPAGEATLSLPYLHGIYILQIGSYSQKVLILP